MPVVVASTPQRRFRFVPAHLPFIEQLYFLGRPSNATLPILLIVAGYYAAIDTYIPPDASLYALLGCVFLIHAGFNILNDIADKHIDYDNNVKTIITSGSPRQVKQLTYGAIGLVLAGIGLAISLPLASGVIVLSMVILSLCYNQKPFQFSRRPIASIASLGVLYGLLPLFAGYFLVTTNINTEIILLGFFWMLGRASLSLLKDFKDTRGDKLHQKQTFLLHFGPHLTLQSSVILGIISYASVSTIIVMLMNSEATRIVAIITLLIVGGIFVHQRLALLRPHSNTDVIFDRLITLQLLVDGIFLACLTLS
jgi:4-hydroxybenzoate polyprenyltransferase